MIIEPKVRGFICTTSHPEGCKENIRKQITYITVGCVYAKTCLKRENEYDYKRSM